MSTASNAAIPKWKIVTSWVLSLIPVLMFVPSAAFKLMASPEFLEQWTKTYPAAAARPIGAVELLCLALYFIPRTRILGAILITGYLGGAVATHVHAGEAVLVIPIFIGVMLWGGLYLRDPRLQELLPLTRD